MAQAMPSGEYSNGPRAGRTTGRQRRAITNQRGKQTFIGLPDPGYLASYTNQMSALYNQYLTRLASLRSAKKLTKSEYRTRVASAKQSAIAGMAGAEGQAVQRGVLGGSADVKQRVGVAADLATQTQQALLDKQATLGQLSNEKVSAQNDYLTALAALQAQKAAAQSSATTSAYANDLVSGQSGLITNTENWKWVGDGRNEQVFMRQNADSLAKYYQMASAADPNDRAFWKNMGKQIAKEYFGWGADEFAKIDYIVQNESKWDPFSANPITSARGIPQAMMSVHFGKNWENNPQAQRFLKDPVWQIVWMMLYLRDTTFKGYGQGLDAAYRKKVAEGTY